MCCQVRLRESAGRQGGPLPPPLEALRCRRHGSHEQHVPLGSCTQYECPNHWICGRFPDRRWTWGNRKDSTSQKLKVILDSEVLCFQPLLIIPPTYPIINLGWQTKWGFSNGCGTLIWKCRTTSLWGSCSNLASESFINTYLNRPQLKTYWGTLAERSSIWMMLGNIQGKGEDQHNMQMSCVTLCSW